MSSRKHEGNDSGAAVLHCCHSCNHRYGPHRLLADALKEWGFKTAFQVVELHPDVCGDPDESNSVDSIKAAIKALPKPVDSDGSGETAIFDRVVAAGLNVGQIEALKAAWIATKRGAAAWNAGMVEARQRWQKDQRGAKLSAADDGMPEDYTITGEHPNRRLTFTGFDADFKRDVEIHVSGAVEFVGRVKNEKGGGWSTKIRFWTREGEERTATFVNSDLMEHTALFARLMKDGLAIRGSTRRADS